MKTTIDFDIKKLIRPNIQNIQPYQSAREELNNKDSILLDANENPFPMGYNRYPDPLQRELKMAIGKWKNLSPENIFLGNGSDEIIDLLIRAFCIPGKDSVTVNVPTYGMYEVCAQINDAKVIKIELDEDFQINPQKILEKSKQAKIIFICSPNNPTGNLMQKSKVLDILENFQGILVIDEAYIDFSEDEGFIGKIKKYPNLIVLQTFSKARAMAGIRLGMGFMNADIVDILNKIKYPYNINQLSQQTALKTLQDNYLQYGVKAIQEQKKQLILQLRKLSKVQKIWPSDANFLLVQFQNHEEIFHFLNKEGIIVRNRSKEPNCEGCLRITVGKSIENETLIKKLEQFELIKNKCYEKNIIS